MNDPERNLSVVENVQRHPEYLTVLDPLHPPIAPRQLVQAAACGELSCAELWRIAGSTWDELEVRGLPTEPAEHAKPGKT